MVCTSLILQSQYRAGLEHSCDSPSHLSSPAHLVRSPGLYDGECVVSQLWREVEMEVSEAVASEGGSALCLSSSPVGKILFLITV
jgi:hypothetical protein